MSAQRNSPFSAKPNRKYSNTSCGLALITSRIENRLRFVVKQTPPWTGNRECVNKKDQLLYTVIERIFTFFKYDIYRLARTILRSGPAYCITRWTFSVYHVQVSVSVYNMIVYTNRIRRKP